MSQLFNPTGWNENFQPDTPARAFGTAFQVSATRPAWVSYSIQMTVQSTLLSGQNRLAQLLSDAVNPPTTIRAECRSSNTQLLGLTITLNQISTVELTYLVPKGHYVLLQTSGTGSAVIVRQVESIL